MRRFSADTPGKVEPEARRSRKSSSSYSTYSVDGTEWKRFRKESRQVVISIWAQIFVASVVAFIAFFLAVLFYPSAYQCYRYQLPSRPLLKGALSVNDVLRKAEFMLEDQIHGPESLLVEGNTIYTGTQDGVIVEIQNGEIRRDIRFKDGPCGTYDLEPICGRPLGIRRLNDEELVVADAYLGIYTVNFDKGTFKQILDGKKKIDGEPLMFLNDVEVANEDLILFTDSSHRWQRRDFLKIVMEGSPDGRVLSLVPSTGQVNVLMENLYFANGIQLMPDKQSFLVCETTMARIMRHYIEGPKKGQTEVFAENLPGMPDNIRVSTNGTLWVGLSTIRRKTHFSMFDYLADRVFLREMLLKLIPDYLWHRLYAAFKPRHSMIVQLDMEGNVLSTAHDLFGDIVSDVSQVSDDENYLYLGSFHADHIARISKTLSSAAGARTSAQK